MLCEFVGEEIRCGSHSYHLCHLSCNKLQRVFVTFLQISCNELHNVFVTCTQIRCFKITVCIAFFVMIFAATALMHEGNILVVFSTHFSILRFYMCNHADETTPFLLRGRNKRLLRV